MATPEPSDQADHQRAAWRDKAFAVIFGVDTPAGKAFDVVLLWCIVLSVVAVMIESVPAIREQQQWTTWLNIIEWFFTGIFTIEYVIRLLCAHRSIRYALSFYGIVDLVAILPTYLAIFIGGAEALIVIRAIRLLRVFRVLKLIHFMQDANLLVTALAQARRKIFTFLGVVVIIATVVGTLMYLVEGGENHGFTSIPTSVYWAIVTITTVGFGDITPTTPVGQFLAGLLMLTGYSIIAVPTGIVSVELAHATEVSRLRGATCSRCGEGQLRDTARYCDRCGERIELSGQE